MSTVAPEPVKQEVGVVGCFFYFLFVCTCLLVILAWSRMVDYNHGGSVVSGSTYVV